ncbi:beta-1,3-glucan-binding protein 2-like [Lasioglossum baleicum]|uniref:beta-1,3-glucan-binding protein 2-like n=1 Tax=Lasioglossum baleicum TaxID=434251 RepID=UPI003FCD4C01
MDNSKKDEDGITLVAYYAKVNDDFYSLEAGTITVDVIKPKNGRWVYQDRSTKLKIGDIVYLWEHVVYNGVVYNLLDQQRQVKEFFNPNGTVVGPTPGGGSTCTTTSETNIYSRDTFEIFENFRASDLSLSCTTEFRIPPSTSCSPNTKLNFRGFRKIS